MKKTKIRHVLTSMVVIGILVCLPVTSLGASCYGNLGKQFNFNCSLTNMQMPQFSKNMNSNYLSNCYKGNCLPSNYSNGNMYIPSNSNYKLSNPLGNSCSLTGSNGCQKSQPAIPIISQRICHSFMSNEEYAAVVPPVLKSPTCTPAPAPNHPIRHQLLHQSHTNLTPKPTPTPTPTPHQL